MLSCYYTKDSTKASVKSSTLCPSLEKADDMLSFKDPTYAHLETVGDMNGGNFVHYTKDICTFKKS